MESILSPIFLHQIQTKYKFPQNCSSSRLRNSFALIRNLYRKELAFSRLHLASFLLIWHFITPDIAVFLDPKSAAVTPVFARFSTIYRQIFCIISRLRLSIFWTTFVSENTNELPLDEDHNHVLKHLSHVSFTLARCNFRWSASRKRLSHLT